MNGGLSVGRFVLSLLLGLCLMATAGTAQAQWVLLARKAIGRVEQLAQTANKETGEQGYDVASVILQARPTKVYETAAALIHRNPELRVLSEDAKTQKIEFTNGSRSAGLSVIVLDKRLAQLVIASTRKPDQDSATSIVLQGVLRVCAQMKVTCTATPGG